jgi:hypothetical protein
MTSNKETQAREAFEKHELKTFSRAALDRHHIFKEDYAGAAMQNRWETWLAAWTAARQDRQGGAGDVWQGIASAPTDGSLIWYQTDSYEDLPIIEGVCAYHPDAGWCVDELRDVARWKPVPQSVLNAIAQGRRAGLEEAKETAHYIGDGLSGDYRMQAVALLIENIIKGRIDIIPNPPAQPANLGVDNIPWPDHAASMHIDHNQHKAYYETVQEALDSGTYTESDFVSAEELQKSKETGEVWSLQWYPSTPTGFCRLQASTLSAILTHPDVTPDAEVKS